MIGRIPIAVFASGSGSNFQAICEAIEAGKINAKIELVVTDKPDAFVVQRAESKGIQVLAINPKNYASKECYEDAIILVLREKKVQWLVLAGYMRLIGKTLLGAYASHIVNIHPSLLPSFPGKDAIGQAMAHGVKITGVTVHFVDEGMDTGTIIMQKAVDIIDEDRDKTEGAIHAVEHELYTAALQKLLN
ncbi:phosphoribosylglycinamide formyltransferase [Kurthia sibirica]|uniref:Phosphoribosylglycinamide formyltransferase n=1 Tax=Kurthia sibirica TaxID=202750 RepID=A0A2U3AL19_9BACL|nr:phosphoribosylglycinamide formyltransferase [Kurthia sibirica]PWI25237.1 phosphoribosylglycinamide formyltransferase [Kurthia sibirica]GEK33738.1 phosphoribosylglycinamide formyltransferase [Kurthia sibirica]